MKHSSGFSNLSKSLPTALVATAATLGVLLAAGGCARNGGGENRFRIPWPNEKGSYSLQDVSISSFDNLQSLQGRFARIFVNPFTRQGRLDSETPVGRFIRSKNGVNIPADYTSLQATAVHAHYERLADMDRGLGVQLNWPMKIGLRSNVKDRRSVVRNNAIFDGRLNALLIVPYTDNGLPIALNAGILAHEHFHMIFQDAVLSRIRLKRKERLELSGKLCEWGAHAAAEGGAVEATDASNEDPSLYASLFNEFTLRALNEGIADFWAWVYTGDVDFIRPSLPSEAECRRMDAKVPQMLSRELSKALVFRGQNANDRRILGKPFNDQTLSGNAYRLGTVYARLMRELAIASSEDEGRSIEGRMKAAKAVVQALPAMATALTAAESKNEFVSANAFLQTLYENWPKNPKDEGSICRIFQRIAAPDPDSFGAKLECPNSSVEVPTPQEESPARGAVWNDSKCWRRSGW